MLTTRIRPKISEKPLATMNSKPGEREPVQQRAGEALPVVDRGAERRRAPVAADVGRRVGENDDVQQGEPDEEADDDRGTPVVGCPAVRFVRSRGHEPNNQTGQIQP